MARNVIRSMCALYTVNAGSWAILMPELTDCEEESPEELLNEWDSDDARDTEGDSGGSSCSFLGSLNNTKVAMRSRRHSGRGFSAKSVMDRRRGSTNTIHSSNRFDE